MARATSQPLTFFEFTCEPLHGTEFTALGRELLGSLPWDEDNPFVSEDYDAEVFMRFDGLQIFNSDVHPLVLNIGFLWRDTVIAFLHIEGARLQNDDVLVLRGIEGRQRVSLS